MKYTAEECIRLIEDLQFDKISEEYGHLTTIAKRFRSLEAEASLSYEHHCSYDNRKLDIIVDFDKTCATSSYPKNRNLELESSAARVLKRLTDEGHRLIISTMRSNGFKSWRNFGTWWGLSDAIDWFEEHKIPLYSFQKNPKQKSWTSSPKCYGDLLIDDIALGAPVKYYNVDDDKPMIDWDAVERILEHKNILKKTL